MKKLKNNLWNRVFHSSELKAQKEKIHKANIVLGEFPILMDMLNNAKSFEDLLAIHKHAYSHEYKNSNLSPCEYGMFRTKNIADMTLDEVYLGDIYGLWTKRASDWKKVDDDKVKGIIFNQYKGLLRSNIFAEKERAYVVTK